MQPTRLRKPARLNPYLGVIKFSITLRSIITNPNVTHIRQIQEWLEQENLDTGTGFYCNWNVIQDSFLKGKLFCLMQGDDVIGFLTFRIDGLVATIDVMEIHPKCRGKGSGKLFFTVFSDIFRRIGCLVVDLRFISDDSYSFWKSLGFIEYPDRGYSGDEDKMYLRLVESASATSNMAKDAVLMLWRNEPHRAHESEPYMIFDLKTKKASNELDVPIIEPCSAEWMIEIRRGTNIIFSDKIKRLDNCKHYHNGYLIVRYQI